MFKLDVGDGEHNIVMFDFYCKNSNGNSITCNFIVFLNPNGIDMFHVSSV